MKYLKPYKLFEGLKEDYQYYMFRLSESLYENWKNIESHMDYICDEFGFENLGQIPTHQF